MGRTTTYELQSLIDEANRLLATIPDLAESGSFSPRTVYYYVQQGLLPRSTSRGPGTSYSEDYLYRLLTIRRLQMEKALRLDDIREVMSQISGDTLKRVALGEERIEVQDLLTDMPRPRRTSSREEVMMIRSGGIDKRSVMETSSGTKDYMSSSPRKSKSGIRRKYSFPLGEDAELVLRKAVTAKQARQLENIARLLEDILAVDEN